MSNETTLTIAGNLVDDPELRFTPSGQPVAKFRVASTPRYRDNATGEWKDGDSLFLTCSVWRQAAENVAESLTRGMRVIITGRLKQRSYETKEGEKRTVYELEVDEVGPSLRNASAKVAKVARSGAAAAPRARRPRAASRPIRGHPTLPVATATSRRSSLPVSRRLATPALASAGAGVLLPGPTPPDCRGRWCVHRVTVAPPADIPEGPTTLLDVRSFIPSFVH